MATVLDEIIVGVRQDLEARRSEVPLAVMRQRAEDACGPVLPVRPRRPPGAGPTPAAAGSFRCKRSTPPRLPGRDRLPVRPGSAYERRASPCPF